MDRLNRQGRTGLAVTAKVAAFEAMTRNNDEPNIVRQPSLTRPKKTGNDLTSDMMTTTYETKMGDNHTVLNNFRTKNSDNFYSQPRQCSIVDSIGSADEQFIVYSNGEGLYPFQDVVKIKSIQTDVSPGQFGISYDKTEMISRIIIKAISVIVKIIWAISSRRLPDKEQKVKEPGSLSRWHAAWHYMQKCMYFTLYPLKLVLKIVFGNRSSSASVLDSSSALKTLRLSESLQESVWVPPATFFSSAQDTSVYEPSKTPPRPRQISSRFPSHLDQQGVFPAVVHVSVSLLDSLMVMHQVDSAREGGVNGGTVYKLDGGFGWMKKRPNNNRSVALQSPFFGSSIPKIRCEEVVDGMLLKKNGSDRERRNSTAASSLEQNFGKVKSPSLRLRRSSIAGNSINEELCAFTNLDSSYEESDCFENCDGIHGNESAFCSQQSFASKENLCSINNKNFENRKVNQIVMGRMNTSGSRLKPNPHLLHMSYLMLSKIMSRNSPSKLMPKAMTKTKNLKIAFVRVPPQPAGETIVYVIYQNGRMEIWSKEISTEENKCPDWSVSLRSDALCQYFETPVRYLILHKNSHLVLLKDSHIVIYNLAFVNTSDCSSVLQPLFISIQNIASGTGTQHLADCLPSYSRWFNMFNEIASSSKNEFFSFFDSSPSLNMLAIITTAGRLLLVDVLSRTFTSHHIGKQIHKKLPISPWTCCWSSTNSLLMTDGYSNTICFASFTETIRTTPTSSGEAYNATRPQTAPTATSTTGESVCASEINFSKIKQNINLHSKSKNMDERSHLLNSRHGISDMQNSNSLSFDLISDNSKDKRFQTNNSNSDSTEHTFSLKVAKVICSDSQYQPFCTHAVGVDGMVAVLVNTVHTVGSAMSSRVCLFNSPMRLNKQKPSHGSIVVTPPNPLLSPAGIRLISFPHKTISSASNSQTNRSYHLLRVAWCLNHQLLHGADSTSYSAIASLLSFSLPPETAVGSQKVFADGSSMVPIDPIVMTSFIAL